MHRIMNKQKEYELGREVPIYPPRAASDSIDPPEPGPLPVDVRTNRNIHPPLPNRESHAQLSSRYVRPSQSVGVFPGNAS